MSFPGCYNLLLEELSMSCVNSLRGDPWKPAPGFPRTTPQVPFPLLILLHILSLQQIVAISKLHAESFQ